MDIDLAAIWTYAEAFRTYAEAFLSSNFFIAIVGSFAGAFAGAYGAQWIVERGKERDEILTDMRNTNAATVVAFAVCTTFLGIKRQHIKPIKENFDNQKSDYLEQVEKYRNNEIPHDTKFHFVANLATMFPPPFPIDTLTRLVHEKISLDQRRPLLLVTALSDAIHGFTSSIDNRNKLVASYKALHLSQDELTHLYFGLPQSPIRVTNTEYPDLIDQIYRHTDDGIFFSKMICDDLFEHNRQMAVKFKNRFRKSASGIIENRTLLKLSPAA